MMISSLFITWNPSPEMFTIPGINWPVRWYGLSWALGFMGCHFVLNRVFKKEGRTEKQLDMLTLYIVIATILGARLGHCLFYDFAYYTSHPLDILKIYEGGLASHGGAIGIVTAMWLYCRKTKEDWLWLFDRMVIVVPFASLMIRFGNLMNSEIVGRTTDVSWAFIFTQVDNAPRHPTQIYEALFYLILFVLFYWLWKHKRDILGRGFSFGLFCVLMFSFRFLMEFLKENQEAFENAMPINMGQILSIPFILIGLYMMYRSRKIMHTPLTNSSE